MTSLLIVGILLLALLRTPLFVVMFLLAAVLFPTATDNPLGLADIFIDVYDGLFSKEYLAPIPLFVFAGFLLAESRSPQRLVRLADAMLGWLPGGLGIVAVASLAFFTAFTGASGVTIIALGGLLWPLLIERGYGEKFSLGVVTASGSIGLLFFPSLPIFLYIAINSISGGQPIEPDALFLAGLLPGLLMVGALGLYCLYRGRKMQVKRQTFERAELWTALRGAWWEVTLPLWLIILLVSGKIGLGGIPFVTVLYLFVVVVFIKRDIKLFRDVPKVAADSAALVGAIVVVLVVIVGLNNYMKIEQVPQQLLAFLQENIDSRLMMLLMLNIFLLIVGCMMDIFSALAAVLPLLIPLAEAYDIHPLHLGIIFLANLEVGYITPPVGMNLFISSLHFKRPLLAVARSILPWLGILLGTLIIITYVEPLSTWLPGVFGKGTVAVTAPAVPGGHDAGTVAPVGIDPEDMNDAFELDDGDLDEFLDEGDAKKPPKDPFALDDEDLDAFLEPEAELEAPKVQPSDTAKPRAVPSGRAPPAPTP